MEDIDPEAERQKRRMYSVSVVSALGLVLSIIYSFQRRYSHESDGAPRGVQCQTQ